MKEPRCSFCDLPQKTVEVLIQSPTKRRKTSWICNKCVIICNQIIALHAHGKTCSACSLSVCEIEEENRRQEGWKK